MAQEEKIEVLPVLFILSQKFLYSQSTKMAHSQIPFYLITLQLVSGTEALILA